MKNQGKKKSELREILSPTTIAKLAKGEDVTTKTIDRLCKYLDCTPNDIMEYTSDDAIMKDLKNFENLDEKKKLGIFEALKMAYTKGYNHMQEMSEEEFEKVKKTPGGPLGNKETRQMAAKTVREIKNETFLAQRDNNRKKKHKDVQTGAENDSFPANETEAADQLMQADKNQKTDKREPKAN